MVSIVIGPTVAAIVNPSTAPRRKNEGSIDTARKPTRSRGCLDACRAPVVSASARGYPRRAAAPDRRDRGYAIRGTTMRRVTHAQRGAFATVSLAVAVLV